MSNHVTSGQSRPWYEHITIDLLAHVLSRSLFHPFIAFLIPLCQRAVSIPYESFNFRATCAWACLVTLCWMFSYVNKHVAYGAPRELDWDEEVVVITGGASGLGKIIAETYGMRGASVAVLDVRKPEKESEGLAGVQFYKCDVGDAEAVSKVRKQIEKDVRSRYNHTSHHPLTLCHPARHAHDTDQQRRHRHRQTSPPTFSSRRESHI